MINKDLFINEIQKLENSWGTLSIKDIENIQIIKSPSNIIFLVIEVRGYKKRLFLKNKQQLSDLIRVLENRNKLFSIMDIIEELNNSKKDKEVIL